MSGLIPITVNTPPGEEAHIRAEDDASVYQSIFGEDGVSTVGQACKATVLSNNKVRIADGIICVGGHFARIPYGDYIDCEIDSGQSEKKRNDIIVARFESTGTGGIDTYTCEVKKGKAGSTATDPEIVQEDLYKAGKVRELPLYRVKIEGLSITAVEKLFTLRKTNEELEKELESLNSKIPKIKSGTKILHGTGNRYLKLFTMAELEEMFGVSNTDSPNYVIYACNADDSALGQIDNGIAYTTDAKAWMLWFESNITSGKNVRINYSVTFNPDIS